MHEEGIITIGLRVTRFHEVQRHKLFWKRFPISGAIPSLYPTFFVCFTASKLHASYTFLYTPSISDDAFCWLYQCHFLAAHSAGLVGLHYHHGCRCQASHSHRCTSYVNYHCCRDASGLRRWLRCMSYFDILYWPYTVGLSRRHMRTVVKLPLTV